MRLITTGPPKCGTTALALTATRLGFERLPGAVIYGEWKRHPEWIENAEKSVHKSVVVESTYWLPAQDAWDALRDGCVIHGHFPPPIPPEIPCIVILRDPRAAMVSWWRAKQKSKRGIIVRGPDRASIALFQRWLRKGGLRAARYIRPIHEGWAIEPERDMLLKVQYESFFTDQTMQLIAQFTNKEPLRAKDIYGRGSKYSGLPSDWRDWYDDAAIRIFNSQWEKANFQPFSGASRGDDLRSFSASKKRL